jgi:hypothetical protein
MNKCSILATTVAALAFMLPSIVSAEEVTPNKDPRILNATGSNWFGFAVSPNRRAFKSESKQGASAEASARNEARNECERTSLRTCYAIAVPDMTDISAVGCTYNGRSRAYLGGSTLSNQQRIALDKANREGFPDSSCVEFYTW